MSLLDARSLVIQYGTGSKRLRAVDGASLEVARGAVLGLVGESGSGKSSIARAMVGLVPFASGQFFVDGHNYSELRTRQSVGFRRRVQMVFQDPYSSLNPRMTIREILEEAVRMQRPKTQTERMGLLHRVVESVGLSFQSLQRYPHQFSGGQQQRIAIARALAVGPQVIILDEVTSALDVSVQASILNLLKGLQRENGLTYLMISHDLGVVRYLSDAVAVMYLGRIVEYAGSEEFFKRPLHPYSQSLISAIPRLTEAATEEVPPGEAPDPRRPPSGCRFHPRCLVGPTARPGRELCTQSDPQLDAESRQHNAACHFVGPTGAKEAVG